MQIEFTKTTLIGFKIIFFIKKEFKARQLFVELDALVVEIVLDKLA